MLIGYSRVIRARVTTFMGFQILIIHNTLFEKTLLSGYIGYATPLASRISVSILQEGKVIVHSNSFQIFYIVLSAAYCLSYPMMVQFSYSAEYVREYIEGAKPIFSVGEYWDSCNYNGDYLDYNQGIQ